MDIRSEREQRTSIVTCEVCPEIGDCEPLSRRTSLPPSGPIAAGKRRSQRPTVPFFNGETFSKRCSWWTWPLGKDLSLLKGTGWWVMQSWPTPSPLIVFYFCYYIIYRSVVFYFWLKTSATVTFAGTRRWLISNQLLSGAKWLKRQRSTSALTFFCGFSHVGCSRIVFSA